MLAEGALHVWCADLDGVAPGLLRLLSESERARAAGVIDAARGRRWACARAVCKELLGRYTLLDPSGLRFKRSPTGKPALVHDAGDPHARRVHFNLSHSGRLALYAVASGGAVGADVEDGSRPADCIALSRRAFGAAESARLARCGDAARRRRFLARWVLAESELKCLGEGLAGGKPPESARRGLWSEEIRELPGAPLALAAVTVLAPPRELRLWAYC